MEEVDLSRQHPPTGAAASRLGSLADAAGSYVFDTYGSGESLQSFEATMATFLGHAKACFFSTGTAAQQAVLYAHATGVQPLAGRHPVVMVHPTSHLIFLDCLRDGPQQRESFAAMAAANLPDFEVIPFGRMECEPTLKEVEAAFRCHEDATGSLPAVLVIELPQRMNGGRTMRYEDLLGVSQLCKRRGVKLHCDGARLWEVQPFYGVRSLQLCLQYHKRQYPPAEHLPEVVTFRDLATLFDSVYVSFYKGVGAMSGAMLFGSEELVANAKVWGKRRGADVFSRGSVALDSEVRFRALYPEIGARIGDTQRPDDSASWTALGTRSALQGVLSVERRLWVLREYVIVVQQMAAEAKCDAIRFDPPVPQSAMVHCYLKGTAALIDDCHARARKRSGVRLWNQLRGSGHEELPSAESGELERLCGQWSYFEWSMGAGNTPPWSDDMAVRAHAMASSLDAVRRGWREFIGELVKSGAASTRAEKRQRDA